MTTESKTVKVPIWIMVALLSILIGLVKYEANQMVKAQDKLSDKVDKLTDDVGILRGQVSTLNIINEMREKESK